ncbi:MAG TPA: ABC transporter substrate-binding protein [Chloroflexota bacterium]|nr:ABC transporter substrate-binding protein [Chloroflexota bacterium]
MKKLLALASLALILALSALGGAVSSAQVSRHAAGKIGGPLNMIAWEGYADPSFVRPFEAQTGCHINVTYAGSSDEMFAKFRAGGGTAYDLVSASGDASLRFIHSGAVQPVNVSKIPNWKNLAPQLKSPPHNTVNGKHYGVSFMWGPDVLIYNTHVFHKAPTSWSVIYSHAYKGRITIPDNPIQIADVAVYLHYKHPYNLSNAQLARIKNVLMAQRPLIRTYWTSAGEFDQLFKNGEVVAGAGWPLMTVQLKQAHVPVADTVPREGATGWADTWMLSSHSSHVACAYAWMNYALSPQVQKKVVAVTDYSPANLKTARLLPASEAKALHITDTHYFDTLKFWQTPPNYTQWQLIWNEIKG